MTQPPMPSLAGVEHRNVSVDGVNLHVAQAGTGPPLLLLHGWPQHWWSWRHLIPALARDHRVIAPDLRGWGWSDAPPGDYAKSTFAQDIVGLLDAEGIDRVKVLAHDWGAFSAFLLGLGHPERVQRLVALDIVPPWVGKARSPARALPRILAYQGLVATPVIGPLTMTGSNHFIRTIIRLGSGPDARWDDAELDAYADVLREPARARASSACYRTFLTRELPEALRGKYHGSQYTVPTLLIMGSASILRYALDDRATRNLQVEWIQGSGHFVAEEAPQAVLDLAVPFLAED